MKISLPTIPGSVELGPITGQVPVAAVHLRQAYLQQFTLKSIMQQVSDARRLGESDTVKDLLAEYENVEEGIAILKQIHNKTDIELYNKYLSHINGG